MAETPRPRFAIADGDPVDPPTIRRLVDFMAQEIVKLRKESDDLYRKKSDRVVANALRVMEGEVSLDKAARGVGGDVLYLIDNPTDGGYYAAWGAGGTPGPTDPGPGPSTMVDHNLLDGDVHPDTIANTPDLGKIAVGDGTDWDGLDVGTDGDVLTADSGAPLGVSWQTPSGGAEVEMLRMYGDGVDGSHTMDGSTAVTGCTLLGGNYFANRNVYFDDLTINNGVSFFPDGWRIFVAGTLTIDSGGEISRNGNAGGNGGNAGGSGGAAGSAGTALNSTGSVPLGGSTSGTNGRVGQLNAGSNATSPPASSVGEGGDGGGGGAGEACGSPGSNAGGPATSGTTATLEPWRTLDIIPIPTFLTLIEGGTGGRGGSSGAGDGAVWGAGGGGGGSGGGLIGIWARFIDNEGSIRAAGGAGGNGGLTDATNHGGAGGGGGGGGGGFVFLVYDTLTGAGTITAPGGAGGVCTNGTDGTDGTNGGDGTAGHVVKYCRLTGVYS